MLSRERGQRERERERVCMCKGRGKIERSRDSANERERASEEQGLEVGASGTCTRIRTRRISDMARSRATLLTHTNVLRYIKTIKRCIKETNMS